MYTAEQLAKYRKTLAEAPAGVLDAIKERRELIEVTTRTSAALADYCKPHRGQMGLIPDHIKQGIEYRRLEADFNLAHKELGQFVRKHPRPKYGKYFDADSHLRFAVSRGLA